MLRMRARLAASRRLLPSSALPRGFGKGALVASLLIASLPNAMAQMSLPGDFAVSPTGGANYKIPIVAPPGTAGMVPSLSLEYSSDTGGSSNGWLGAGLLGVGWTLAGLPAIGRCPQTVDQDNAVGSITYTANDRFCLDGQRLVAISGTYGADGTQYRTEIESFSQIISHGSAGTGPAWFEVQTKAGQILQFGNTTGSTGSRIPVLSQGSPTSTARSWAINQVSDTKGNYYSIIYNNDTTNGQAYPVTINYTGNSTPGVNLLPYNSVQFVYASRPDIVPIYQAGTLMQTTKRLTDVQTYAGTQLVRDYKLAYQQGSATGRSQLASITLCGGDGTCLPPTTFTWQNGSTTPTVVTNVGNQNGQLEGARPYLANFTGSGLTSIMWDVGSHFSFPYSSGTRELWSFDNNQFSVNTNFAGQNGNVAGYVPIVADFNRDGRADVWWYAFAEGIYGNTDYTYAAGPTTTWLSTGDGTYAFAAGPTVPTTYPSQLLGADDINGDGRTDLYWINQTEVPGSREPLSANLLAWVGPNGSTISTNSTADVLSIQSGCPNAQSGGFLTAVAADLNGDGFSDLLWVARPFVDLKGDTILSTYNCPPTIWWGNGDGTFRPVGAGYTAVSGYTPYLGDFNGDGKMDILWDLPDTYGRSTGTHVLWISAGDGTFVVNNNPGNLNSSSLAGYLPTIADFNGDGIADILWVSVDQNGLSTGSQVLWLGQGNGNFTVTPNFMQTGPVSFVPYVGDFNGDGKADVLWDSRSANDSRSTGTRIMWMSDGLPPDLLTGFTNGVGATVNVTYQSITNGPPLYTKGNSAVDPQVDVQAPMQVVSQVNRSNGIGGTVSTTYAYAAARMDNDGRGFEGFRQVTATDLQTNIVETSSYVRAYPYTMQLSTDTKTLGSITLSTTTNTYGSISLTPAGVGGVREQVLLNQTVTGGSDLGGYALPTTTTSYTYDAYNNATQIAVSVNDDSSKTTTNTFTNDTTNWFLGRLTASSVTSTAPVPVNTGP
jgi:hypothetical protein